MMSMQSLMTAGTTLKQMQTMQSASTALQGQANVYKAEMKLDQSPDERKEAAVEELENRSQNVTGRMMEMAQEVTEKLQKEAAEEKAEAKQEANTQDADVDRAEISAKQPEGQEAVAVLLDAESGYGYTEAGAPILAEAVSRQLDVTV